jgi:serine/threonine protein kinase
MGLATGARLGPYDIVAPLGAGGMGGVYKAKDTRLDRTVAHKILRAPLAGDPYFRTSASGSTARPTRSPSSRA